MCRRDRAAPGAGTQRCYRPVFTGIEDVRTVRDHDDHVHLRAPHHAPAGFERADLRHDRAVRCYPGTLEQRDARMRSEEHTSELQSLMRTSYAVLCLQKKNK